MLFIIICLTQFFVVTCMIYLLCKINRTFHVSMFIKDEVDHLLQYKFLTDKRLDALFNDTLSRFSGLIQMIDTLNLRMNELEQKEKS